MKNKKEKSPVRKTIALAGNPNSGKTTLFNLLTKSHQHIGNWPGVTVERKEGRYFKDTSLKIVDLPGIYSLTPLSVDEEVAHNYINNDRPDLIIDVVDSTNLERNLFLTSQLLELDIPVVVALNMEDEARAKGIGIDGAALEKVFGCPFFSVSASKNTGVDELMSFCGKEVIKKESALTYFADVESALDKISKAVKIPVNKRWISLKLLEKDSLVTDAACLSPSQTELINGLNAELENKYKNSLSSEIAKQRYDQLNVIACKATRSVARQTADDSDKKQSKRKKSQKNDGLSLSDKIDKVVTNKWLAFPIFAVVMFLVFMISIQTIGGWITSLINDDFTPWFQEWVRSGLDSVSSPQWLSSLVCDGVIAGVLAVVGFVPQIMILFGLIAILEASGYMSRVAFIMDRLCNAIGLSGKSFVSMVVGCGCSVPAIMSARTIKNVNERNNTIILTPFIPCSAKLPLFAFFTTAVFNGSALAATSMYFVGIFSVVAGGLILKVFKRRKTTVRDTFIMELPSYRLPKASNVLKEMWERGKAFLLRASTVILAASIVLWFLQSFDYKFAYGVSPARSILAERGRLLAPVFKPLGWGNWQTAVATLTGLAAKETVVTTLNILGVDGTMFTPLSAYSFMTFNLLAAPCISAIAASFRELHSAKTGWFAIAFQICFAYVVSLVIYQAGILYAKNNTVFWSVVGTLAAAVFLYTGIKLLIKHRGCNMECDHCPKNKNCKR